MNGNLKLLMLDAFQKADSKWPEFTMQALGTNTIFELVDTICKNGTFRGEQQNAHLWNVHNSTSAPNYGPGIRPDASLMGSSLSLRVGSTLAITYDYGDVLCLFVRVRSIANADQHLSPEGAQFPVVISPRESQMTSVSSAPTVSLNRPKECPSMDELFPNIAKAVLDPKHQGFILGHAASQLFAAIEHPRGGNGDMLYMPLRYDSWDAALVAMEKALHPSSIDHVPSGIKRDWIGRMMIPARELSPSEKKPYDNLRNMEKEEKRLRLLAGVSADHVLSLDDAQRYGASDSFMYWMCGPYNVIFRDTVAKRDADVAALRAKGFSSRTVLPRTDAAFSGSSHRRRWISYKAGILRVCKNTIVDPSDKRECEPRNVIRTVPGPFKSLEHLFAEIEASWPA